MERMTAGLIFDGPYEELIKLKGQLENTITASGCRVIYGKAVTKPKRLIIVEDGPAQTFNGGV